MSKRESKATKSIEGNVLTITFADESVVTIDVTDLAPNVRQGALMHGLSQKVGDSYSGAKTVREAREAAEKTIATLLAGDWTAARQGGGAPRSTLLAEAIFAIGEERGATITMEQVLEAIENSDDARKKALRADPVIKAKMSEIKAARDAEKAAESSSILDGMFGA